MFGPITAGLSPGRARRALLGYVFALALSALATLVAVLVDHWTRIPNLSLVFVLPVVIAAVSFGWGPALGAAIAGVLSFNFFLIEPRYTLRVDDPANLWALILLSVVAAIVSALAAHSRRRTMEALAHADQAEALQTLARALVAATDRTAIMAATANALERLFKAPAVVLVAEGDGLRSTATGAEPSEADLEAARWAIASRFPTRADAYPVEGSRFDFWPIRTPSRLQAAVGVEFVAEAVERTSAPEGMVEIVSGYLAVALERDSYAAQALEARVGAASERVKASLLAAVSHDLRTPLATILFTLQSLQRFGDHHDAGTRAELLRLAETETARLTGLVANLLNMSRIDEHAVAVKPAPASPADLVASALERARTSLQGRAVINAIDPTANLVQIDYSLTETVLANVLENAGKYSPAGSTIILRGTATNSTSIIEVLDEGPGFPGEIEPLFEKFTRGVEGDGRPPGTGLGLAIARGFLEAQGGRIEACNRLDRSGGLVRVFLPLANAEPVSA